MIIQTNQLDLQDIIKIFITNFQNKKMFFKFVPTNSTGIVQRFGKYARTCSPGLNICLPFIEQISLVSNRCCQHAFKISARTADKVFPELDVAIQYQIKPQNSVLAFFVLESPIQQMTSYITHAIRRQCSLFTLDQLFQSQKEIQSGILLNVGSVMEKNGYSIESAQIRNIKAPTQVEHNMNEINSSERKKIIAKNEAQAHAITSQFRGKGIALQRDEITKGWSESIAKMAAQTQTSPEQVMKFLLHIFQQETNREMSRQAGTKVIFTEKTRQKFMEALQ